MKKSNLAKQDYYFPLIDWSPMSVNSIAYAVGRVYSKGKTFVTGSLSKLILSDGNFIIKHPIFNIEIKTKDVDSVTYGVWPLILNVNRTYIEFKFKEGNSFKYISVILGELDYFENNNFKKVLAIIKKKAELKRIDNPSSARMAILYWWASIVVIILILIILIFLR